MACTHRAPAALGRGNRRACGHARATHELFDAADGDIIPCVKVASEMLDGGVLGAVEVAIDADLTSFRVVIDGGNSYRLVDGELVLEVRPG